MYPNLALSFDSMCFGASDDGNEWVELRFPSEMYVSGFEIYEVWAMGSLSRVATAKTYEDDNTIPCKRETCSQNTTWKTIWQGTAAVVEPSNGEGRIFSPPVR